jgi:hypothetical protein
MEIQEALQWTDDLIFSQTGQHLDSLQRAILEGSWESKGYKEIAEDYHCSGDHVRKSASEFWKLLSDVLGEEVKKKNVRSLIENGMFSYNHVVQVGSQINVCRDLYESSEKTTKQSPSGTHGDSQPRHDLSQAPEADSLYNRTDELQILKQWILEDNSRIVTITGLSGIGKTAIATQLVTDIKDNFDRILWCSHCKCPSLNTLKSHLLEFLTPTTQQSSSLNDVDFPKIILENLRNYRCLIILDDLQETLISGQFVGHYRPEYEKYGQFINEVGKLTHNSCFLFLGWEKPRDIAILENQSRYCKTLNLLGLGQSASQILDARQLKDKSSWSTLIERYNGNPLWLNIIATTILELFEGKVEYFIIYSDLYLGDLEPIISQHYKRLSKPEKLLLQWLSEQDKSPKISQKQNCILSQEEFLKSVQSLKKRNFLQKTSTLILHPVIRKYVKSYSNPV